jgi:hypothetical protein
VPGEHVAQFELAELAVAALHDAQQDIAHHAQAQNVELKHDTWKIHL